MFKKIKNIVQSLYNTYIKKDKNINTVSSIKADSNPIDFDNLENLTDEEFKKILEELNKEKIQDQIESDIEDYESDYPYEEEETPKEKYYRERRELTQKIRLDPLSPYFRSYSMPEHQGSLIYKFNKEGRPLLPEDYANLFQKYISHDNFLAENKIPYLNKIWEDAKILEKILQPLTEMSIDYSLDLTGGSVRDYVLGNHDKIKDLDFMVSVQDEHVSYYKIEQHFSQAHIQEVNINSDDSLETKKVKLVQLCLLKSQEEITVYNHIKDNKYNKGSSYDPYFEITSTRPDEKARIMAVYKINQRNTHYPIDIILTDYSKPHFIDDFDFDICKASLCFINSHVNKQFPSEPNHLISRFVAPNEFWADVHNKRITYNCGYRNIYHVNGAFDKHLPRVKAKYFNHEVLVVGDGEQKDFIKAKLLSEELNDELENKSQVKSSKKLKL